MRSDKALGQRYMAVCNSMMLMTEQQLEKPSMTALSYYEAACFLDYLTGRFGEEKIFAHMNIGQKEMEELCGMSFQELFADGEAYNLALFNELGMSWD